jgi:glutamate-1-semialdehyde 2,1-aminomutase/spore coat polysaccharide biosynthesis protein SpsF
VTTAAIVQARIGSSRLPGKVLMPLGDRTALEQVLGRCKLIPGTDVVVCAIPEGPANEVLEAFATRAGAIVVRGSETDVLGRYLRAAKSVGADVIVRVTSDCPLIDPVVCGEVLQLRTASGAAYASNNMPPSFPHGLDCEAFTLAALAEADRVAHSLEDREHVSEWMRSTVEVRRAALQGPGGAWVGQRWTLDYPEDYAFLERVFAMLPSLPTVLPWRKMAAIVERSPDLIAINAHRMRPP